MPVIPDITKEKLQKTTLILKLLWTGMLLNIPIFTIIAYAGKHAEPSHEKNLIMLIGGILTMLALCGIFFSLFIKMMTLTPGAVAKVIQGSFPDLLYLNKNYHPPAGKSYEELSEAEKRIDKYTASIIHYYLLTWGGINACAVAGLPLAIISGQPSLFFPFAAAAAVLSLANFPAPDKIIRKGLELYTPDNNYTKN
jgi:hypothetical protein